MAVLDDLERVKQQVARRLRELEPLVAEYNELQQVADRLGISPADGRAPRRSGRRSRGSAATGTRAVPAAGRAKTTRASSRRSSTRRTARSRRTAVAPGSRQQDVLRLVGERPGISVPELGKELGVDPTGLYQIVRRLEGRGAIRKDGRELRPVATGAQDAGAAGA
jgi:hypothetical protein